MRYRLIPIRPWSSRGACGGATQQLTAVFHAPDTDNGVTPAAVAHYGRDFIVGQPSCAPASIGRTCTVSVNFTPTLPGARPDALFLMNGSERLATVMLSGAGQSPLALFEPSVGKAGSNGASGLAAVDELVPSIA